MPAQTADTLTVTASADTLAMKTGADSVASANPWVPRHCSDAEAPRPMSVSGKVYFHTGRVDYVDGVVPAPRPLLPGYDTGVLCLLLGVFLIISFNFRHYSIFLKTFAQDLWKVRNRDNVFDDHTMSETRVLTSFVLLLCVGEGIITYSAMAAGSDLPIFPAVGICTCVALCFYFFQMMIYRTVGYTFTTMEKSVQWVKGFRASQCLLGMVLIVPAMVVLFNPGLTVAVTVLAITAYALARIIFVLKGFRIFYDNPFSIVYFILYLCTLEIILPMAVLTSTLQITHFILNT